MKRFITFLLCSIGWIGQAQTTVNLSFRTLAEMSGHTMTAWQTNLNATVFDTNRGGLFQYTPATVTTNAGTVYAAAGGGSWIRPVSGPVNLAWFGLHSGNTAAQNTAVLASAIAAGFTNIGIPSGNFTFNPAGNVTSALYIHALSVEDRPTITANTSADVWITAKANIRLEGLHFYNWQNVIEIPYDAAVNFDFIELVKCSASECKIVLNSFKLTLGLVDFNPAYKIGRVVVDSCTFVARTTGVNQMAINLESYPFDSLKVVNCDISGGQYGIYAGCADSQVLETTPEEHFKNVLISGNRIHDMTGQTLINGLYLFVKNAIVSDNVLDNIGPTDAQSAGLYLQCSDTTIADNIFTGCGKEGSIMHKGARYGSVINSPMGYGTQIIGNQFRRGTNSFGFGGHILIECEKIRISGNTFDEVGYSTSYVIAVELTTSGDSYAICDNTFIGQQVQNPIYFKPNENTTLANVVVRGNSFLKQTPSSAISPVMYCVGYTNSIMRDVEFSQNYIEAPLANTTRAVVVDASTGSTNVQFQNFVIRDNFMPISGALYIKAGATVTNLIVVNNRGPFISTNLVVQNLGTLTGMLRVHNNQNDTTYPSVFTTVGKPESLLSAPPGSQAYDTAGTLWVKRTGTGTTGWRNATPTLSSTITNRSSLGGTNWILSPYTGPGCMDTPADWFPSAAWTNTGIGWRFYTNSGTFVMYNSGFFAGDPLVLGRRFTLTVSIPSITYNGGSLIASLGGTTIGTLSAGAAPLVWTITGARVGVPTTQKILFYGVPSGAAYFDVTITNVSLVTWATGDVVNEATIPSGSLYSSGDVAVYSANVTLANNANAKSLLFSLGSDVSLTTLPTTVATYTLPTSVASSITLLAKVFRVTDSTVKVECQYNDGVHVTNNWFGPITIPGSGALSANAVYATLLADTDAAAADVVFNSSTIEVKSQ